MGFLKWKDWIGGALNVFKETPASDIGEGLIRHEWQGDKYNVQQIGTTLKADIMNNLQMGLDFLVDSNHTVVNSEDHYVITIDGLKTDTSNPDGYELTENLHFSVKIAEDNGNGISKLIINGDSYDLQKKETGALVELDALDLKAGKVCKVYYDGTRFIIDASSLPATDTTAGIISLNGIRAIAAEVSGGKYDGIFGSDLTSITSGNTYIYIDSNEVGTVYLALTTATNASGFIVPDTTNFANISNISLYDRSAAASTNIIKYESGMLMQIFNANAGAAAPITSNFPMAFSVAPTMAVATHNGTVADGTNIAVNILSASQCAIRTSYTTNIGVTVVVYGRWK